jgi:Reverse transcriptase (RNA-dependent DNA polymerase)
MVASCGLSKPSYRQATREDWRYHATLSGCPQGSIVSPVLANIYLDKLDTFVETEVLPAYSRGHRRRTNPAYASLQARARRLRRAGQWKQARQHRRQMQQLPSLVPTDPGYRRMRYLRYADDWLIGFIGPRSEAEAIKRRLKEFLREQLKLTLSETKTLLTHARSERARFLGYEIAVAQADHKHDRRGHRSINGQIGRKTCPSGSFKPNVVPISNEASRST